MDGKFGKTKVVVAKHPQGKSESTYVKQVEKSFAIFVNAPPSFGVEPW